MVEIKNLTFGFDKTIFNNFSYRFPDKGIVAVTGSSGAGKTTLLNVIAGIIKTDAVTREGTLSFLFQDNRLLPWLTVLENAELVSKEKNADEFLKKVGLSLYLNHYPDALSGGMQRRASFAAALSAKADVILLDEPTANLDKENADVIRALINEASKSSLVIISSHVDEDVSLADEVIEI